MGKKSVIVMGTLDTKGEEILFLKQQLEVSHIDVFHGSFQALWDVSLEIIQGVILVGIMLLAPQGIMGSIRKTRAYRSLLQLATRR